MPLPAGWLRGGPRPEEHGRRAGPGRVIPVSALTWRDVVFLHWPCEPAAAAPLLPPGTAPDVLDGSTWVGVVLLRMIAVRPAGLPPQLGLREFAQVNLRIYSVDSGGRHGVVFRGLEIGRPAVALAARALTGLACHWSAVTARTGGGMISYDLKRCGGGPRRPGLRCGIRHGSRRVYGCAAEFLTARWGLHLVRAGRLFWVPVSHEPWELYETELADFADNGLLAATGLPVRGAPASVIYAPVAHARIGLPRPV
jgi:uncharacterized protein YqjF (DUF2071 family)